MEPLIEVIKAGNRPTTIEVVSAKTILVPRELFDAQSADYLLQLSGMALTDEETILHSDPKGQTIVLMAVPNSSRQAIEEQLQGHIAWSSPLLHTPDGEVAQLWIARFDDLIYLKIWGTGQALRQAEVLRAPAAEDTLYYVTELARELNLGDCPIRVEKRATADAHLLRKYFKHVTVCE